MVLGLHNLRSKVKRPARKRLGRGNASGTGTYSGRGLKGQHSRAGGGSRPGFEGGRSTLIIQTPKMRGDGFRSPHPKLVAVTVERLNAFKDGDTVSTRSLLALGIIKKSPIKIVGGGELKRKLTVNVPATAGAKSAIEKAGGSVIIKETQKKDSATAE